VGGSRRVFLNCATLAASSGPSYTCPAWRLLSNFGRLHNVLIATGAIRRNFLNFAEGSRPDCPVRGPKFHEVSKLCDSLWPIGNVGATVVSHDVGIAAGSGGRVVDGSTFIGHVDAMVMLVQH
jgi:hypothetical protein